MKKKGNKPLKSDIKMHLVRFKNEKWFPVKGGEDDWNTYLIYTYVIPCKLYFVNIFVLGEEDDEYDIMIREKKSNATAGPENQQEIAQWRPRF